MNVIYGISLEDEDDRYVRFAERALDGMAKAARPGAFLVSRRSSTLSSAFSSLVRWM